MAGMRLHWSPLSPFVRKVMCVIHERDLLEQVECVRTQVARNQPNPALVSINPLIRIPTLELGDGRVLFDSVVICEYLATLGSGLALYPHDADARWQALRWQAFGDGLCDTLLLWRHERERPGEQQQVAFLDASRLKVEASLAMLEQEVAQLQRAEFGIGHIAVGCALGYLGVRFADLAWQPRYPHLAQWHQAFEARPCALATAPPNV